MPIMRTELRATGNAGSTWPSAPRPTMAVARRDPVDEAGLDSFPCSDPPAWTAGVRAHTPASVASAPVTRQARPEFREVDVVAMSDIQDGQVRRLEVEGHEIALCRVDEEVFALSGTCSYHPIPWRNAKLDGEVLTCPWYGAQFDVRTGQSVFLHSTGPLATYRTAVREGRVFVQLPVEPPGAASSRWIAGDE